MTKKEKEISINAIDKDNWEPYIKNSTRVSAISGGAIGMLRSGRGLISGKRTGKKVALGKVVGGGAIGAGIGAGAGYLLSKLNSKLIKDAKNGKSNNKFIERLKKESDLIKVSNGEMSKKDFIKKYYK